MSSSISNPNLIFFLKMSTLKYLKQTEIRAFDKKVVSNIQLLLNRYFLNLDKQINNLYFSEYKRRLVYLFTMMNCVFKETQIKSINVNNVNAVKKIWCNNFLTPMSVSFISQVHSISNSKIKLSEILVTMFKIVILSNLLNSHYFEKALFSTQSNFKRNTFTILRSPHTDKKSREQFSLNNYKSTLYLPSYKLHQLNSLNFFTNFNKKHQTVLVHYNYLSN